MSGRPMDGGELSSSGRHRLREMLWGETLAHEQGKLEYFTTKKSLKERLNTYFVQNRVSSLRIRAFTFAIKALSCLLYVIRVSFTEQYGTALYTCFSNFTLDDRYKATPDICWIRLLWVNRPFVNWVIQTVVAIISLIETLILLYLNYKGNILQQVFSLDFMLELCTTVPFFFGIPFPKMRHLFVPVFLNCWLAKSVIESMLHDLVAMSSSALLFQVSKLCVTVFCLIFTSACGVQHLQRGGFHQVTLFQSLYFVVVTISTVGYGDICPDIWPSQLFMVLMISTALIVLPQKLEQVAYIWMERRKSGGAYSSHRARHERHVVVCVTALHADSMLDFLQEFYAHQMLQDYVVVFLSPSDIDTQVKNTLEAPVWDRKVKFIQGSALKDSDLSRCCMHDAVACFILADRSVADRNAADQHTILRSWAVRDFAPKVPLYTQIFRPENIFHVKFADNVVCEDEFRYALLANNCLHPGTSTLVTLLLHTSRGEEGQYSSERWHRLYGRCSGNEIYHVRLGESKFFGKYEGKSFTYASFHAHRKYGVALVGVKPEHHSRDLLLNPGPRHLLRSTDICLYLSLADEEQSKIVSGAEAAAHVRKTSTRKDGSKIAASLAGIGTMALEMQHTRTDELKQKMAPGGKFTILEVESEAGSSGLDDSDPVAVATKPAHLDTVKLLASYANQSDRTANADDQPESCKLKIQSICRRPSIGVVPAQADETQVKRLSDASGASVMRSRSSLFDQAGLADQLLVPVTSGKRYVVSFPPFTPYVGTSPTLCHLCPKKRNYCCLELSKSCAHCSYRFAKQYNWTQPAIVLCADFAGSGLYNFIVPLRSHHIAEDDLRPIVLMLEQDINADFRECICHFPLVFWMKGTIENVDDLLMCGLTFADNVVIVNKELSNAATEDTLADCNTIVAVQTIFRLFPNINIITELSRASNMRFMQFRAQDRYSARIAKMEKKEKERGSHLYYMFRLPFAAGCVFSASMLDTLLYQSFVEKDYLVDFVRLLLGIGQAAGSGHLFSMRITKDDLWIRTYGRLYQKLCSTTCEIPIGIYRTETVQIQDQSGPVVTNSDSDSRHWLTAALEDREIRNLINFRMRLLGLATEEKDVNIANGKASRDTTISYVIINPTADTRLELNDLIYLIKPTGLNEPSTDTTQSAAQKLFRNATCRERRERPEASRLSPTVTDASESSAFRPIQRSGSLPSLSTAPPSPVATPPPFPALPAIRIDLTPDDRRNSTDSAPHV